MFLRLKNPMLFSLLSLLIISAIPCLALAQSADSPNKAVDSAATLGVAKMIEVKGKNIKDGSVISTSAKGAILSNVPYDGQVLGIVSRDAAIVLNSTGSANGVPVISNGQVYVLVSAQAGTIKKGDLLTTSTIPGVAVKAVKSGYVLGNAMEDYVNTNAKQTGKIAVELDLHYFNSKSPLPGTLTDIFKIALLPTKDSPQAIYKYIVAAAVVLSSFVLTFMTFGRTAAKGVEALGRNPAASRIIHLGIIFNIGICVAITLVGLTVAFLILRL